MKKQIILGHIAPLLLGGFIYILFRTTTLKMFQWFHDIGFSDEIKSLRNYTAPFSNRIPNWFLFSLPDGLWIFSYITLVLYIWKNQITAQSAIWVFIIPFIATLSEAGQFLKMIPGTFDIIDLVFYLLGSILPFIIFKSSLTIKIKTT